MQAHNLKTMSHQRQCGVMFCFDIICLLGRFYNFLKIVSEYDQEISQSQTADNPMEPRGRAAQQPSRDTRKTK